MAYDAGILRLIVNEVKSKEICKVEKIYQPSNDEIIILLRSRTENLRLLINVGSNYPRMNFTSSQSENPNKAPMFCMLLRKHLAGAKLLDANQYGYERACELEFEAYDEMGFKSKKYIICEIMGKYSNLILTDADKKIIAPLKSIDISTSEKRPILSGMKYELPPKQDKTDPLAMSENDFDDIFARASKEMRIDKFITSYFMGIAQSTAREIAYSVAGSIDAILAETDKSLVKNKLFEIIDSIKNNTAQPYLVLDGLGSTIEYSYTKLEFYGKDYSNEILPSFSELIDSFYAKKSKNERIKQKSTDIQRLLTNAENRINRKIAVQTEELKDCEQSDEYKLFADLITANIYLMKKGASSVKVVNYYDENCNEIEIPLDTRLTPAQNAQRYYKRYTKAKTAKIEISKQIELARVERDYISTVAHALTKAETENDLNEIREELYHSGYASRMKNYSATKIPSPKPLKFKTSGGYTVLCGKNNKQNDYITTKLSSKLDWWFHVKNLPGSHVLMQSNGEEPSEKDFTEAAEIAAYYSKAEGDNIAVDYTQIKHVKKPAGSKPGYVIYHVNWTAYVTPNEKKVNSLLEK